MELGEPDDSGRRRPVPMKGSEFRLEIETVIEAIGQSPNPIIQATTPGLDTAKKGTVVTDERQRTSRPGIFAGGDLARGGATVILAMRDGKTAAAAIHEYLTEQSHATCDLKPCAEGASARRVESSTFGGEPAPA